MTITLQRLVKTTGSTMTGTVHWDKHNGYGFKVRDGDALLVSKDFYPNQASAARAMRRWLRTH